MGKKLTPEKLLALRRLRKARRLYKQQPVFAFAILCSEYSDYTHEQFLDDLRLRTKPKSKMKKITPLSRYGRYYQMNKFLEMYENTGLLDHARKALQLRSVMTKPYRVLVKVQGVHIEYRLSALIPHKEVVILNANLRSCKTEEDVDKMIDQFREDNRL